MKRQRFYSIHILKPGDPEESFDPSEYLKELMQKPESCTGFAFIKGKHEGTSIWVNASWNEVRYSETLLHYLRNVLWIFARACRKIIDDLYSNIVFSKTDQGQK